MLFSICGPSSCGKGTILSSLKNDFGYKEIQNQFAREVMKKMNMTTKDISSSLENTIKFHETLFLYKRDVEESFVSSKEVFLTERSFIDFYIYYSLILDSFDKNQESKSILDNYYMRCIEYSLRFYSSIFFVSEIPHIEDDGIRIVDINFINKQKELFDIIFSKRCFQGKVIKVMSRDKQERRDFISSEINRIKTKT